MILIYEYKNYQQLANNSSRSKKEITVNCNTLLDFIEMVDKYYILRRECRPFTYILVFSVPFKLFDDSGFY